MYEQTLNIIILVNNFAKLPHFLKRNIKFAINERDELIIEFPKQFLTS